jgi:hypothetical protein
VSGMNADDEQNDADSETSRTVIFGRVEISMSSSIRDFSAHVTLSAPTSFEDRFLTMESLLDVGSERLVEQLRKTLALVKE